MFLQLVAGHWWLILCEVLQKQHGHVDNGTIQLHAETYFLTSSPKSTVKEDKTRWEVSKEEEI